MDDDSEDFFEFSWKINLTKKTSVDERLTTNVESKKNAKEKAVESRKTANEKAVVSKNKTVRERLAEIRLAEIRAKKAKKLKSPVLSAKKARKLKSPVLSAKKAKELKSSVLSAKKAKELKSPVLLEKKNQTSVLKNNKAQGEAPVSKSKVFADELRQPTKISVCRKLFDEIDSPSKATVSVKPPIKLNNNFEESFRRESSLKAYSPFQNKDRFGKSTVANNLLNESNITDFEKNEQLNVDELVDLDWNISLSRKSSDKKVPLVNDKERVIQQLFIEAEGQRNSENEIENFEVLRNLKTKEKPKKRIWKKTRGLSKGLEKNSQVETESKTLNSPNGKKFMENIIVSPKIRIDDKALNNSRNVSEKVTGKNCVHSNINSIHFEILDLNLPLNGEPKENEIGDGVASSRSTVSSSITRRSLRFNEEENFESKYFPKTRPYKKRTNNLKGVDSELLTKASEQCKSFKKKKFSKSSKEKERDVDNVERIGANIEKSPGRNRVSIESRTELEQEPAKKAEKKSPQKTEAQVIDKEENVNTEKRPVRKRGSTVLTTELVQGPTVPEKKTEHSSPHKVETQFIDKEEENVNAKKRPERRKRKSVAKYEQESAVPAKETENQSQQKMKTQFIDKEESVNTEKRPVRKRVSTVLTTELVQEPTVPEKKTENSSPHKVETQLIDKEEENVNAKKHPERRKRKSVAKFEQELLAISAKETENPSLHNLENQNTAIDVSLGESIPSKRLKSDENANEQIKVFDSNLREIVALDCVQHQEFYKFDVAKNENVSVAKILRHEQFATGIMKLNPKEEKGHRFTLGDTLAFWISRGTLEVTIHETKIKLFENDMFYVPAENGYNIVNLSDYEATLIFFQLKSYTPTT